jgi:hypothetical protein
VAREESGDLGASLSRAFRPLRTWAAYWDCRARQVGPKCTEGRPEEDPSGEPFFAAFWTGAYLLRRHRQPGGTVVIFQ